MSNTYTISKDVIDTIFKGIVSETAVLEKRNAKHISTLLLNELSDTSIESIIHLMLTSQEYKALKIGVYVRIKVNLLYHDGDKKLKEYEHEVNPLSCIKVNKGTISYFKPKKQNQDA